MKMFLLAAAVATTAVISMAVPSEAGSRWHKNKHFYGHGHYDKHITFYYDDYYDDEYCYTKKVRKHGYWKKITICE